MIDERRIADLMADLNRVGHENDALRAELSKQQTLTVAAQHIAEVAQSRANQLRARIKEREKQEPVAWCATDETGTVIEALGMKLRRLAQAATPGPWIGCGPSFGESLPKYLNEVVVDREGDEDDGYSICNAPIGLDEEHSADMTFIAAANPAAINELLDRLEAAEKAVTEAYQRGYATGQEEIEKERDALRALVVMRFDHDYPPQFTQGHDLHELTEPVTAEHCRWFVAEIERLRTDCDALRAKIEAMERQEPVAWRRRSDYGWSYKAKPVNGLVLEPLYLAPGAQPAPSIPKISDDLIEVIESRAEQSYRRHHGGIRGQQVTPADALSWHIIHATRDVLATAAQEAKP